MTRPTGLLMIAMLCTAAVGCGDTSGAEALFAEWPSGGSQDGGTFTNVRLADSGAQSQDGGQGEASPGQGGSNKGGKKGGPKGVGGGTAKDVGFSAGAMASEAVATWQAGIPPTGSAQTGSSASSEDDNATDPSPSEPTPAQQSDPAAGSDQGSSGSKAEPGDSGNDGGQGNGHGKGGKKKNNKGKHGKD